MWEYRNQRFNYFALIFSLSQFLFIIKPDYAALPRFLQTSANSDNHSVLTLQTRNAAPFTTLFKATVYLQGFDKFNGYIRSASQL